MPTTGNFLTEDDLYIDKERKCKKCKKQMNDCTCEEDLKCTAIK